LYGKAVIQVAVGEKMKSPLTIFLIFPFVGCVNANDLLEVKRSSLYAESQLNQLPEEMAKIVFALNFSDGKGIFDGGVNVVEINGVRILYREKSNEIYILNGNNRFIRVDSNLVIVYKNHIESPSIGTEQVEIAEQYINYYGNKYAFQDHGYDGIDVQYEIMNTNSVVHSIKKEKCMEHIPLALNVTCCKIGMDKYVGFIYSNENGWEERNTLRLNEKCQSLK
jgi:hypothetical protein